MRQPKVSILIPNYKTLELTKLCLRLIRKHTNPEDVHVIVIDNDSQDESLVYLKSLQWIELIERPAVPNEPPTAAHAQALDLALQKVTTPYVLSIHTDTLVKHPNWLPYLLSQFSADTQIAGVGSWKLELKPWWRRLLKTIEHFLQLGWYRLIDKKQHGLVGIGTRNYYYLRSHCAMYRTDIIRQLHLKFSDGDMVAGKFMHKAMIAAGYKMIFLPSTSLSQYIDHINHATTVLNPELSSREKSVLKGLRRIQRSLAKLQANHILADASLDH